MNEILTIPFAQNFIPQLGDYILQNYGSRDLSELCVVFPGKRPSLFLLDYLKEKIHKPFIPLARFSIDEFTQYLFSLKRDERISEGRIDLIYLLYKAIRDSKIDEESSLGKISKSIHSFIHWGEEVLRATEEVEIQCAREPDIESVTEYDENIIQWVKDFWENFTSIKNSFEKLLKDEKLTYRGEVYRWVSENIQDIQDFIPFERIIFAGFYALNKSEWKVMKYLFEKDMADIIIQTDEKKGDIPETSPYYFHNKKWKRDWNVDFRKIAEDKDNHPDMKIYQCFDTHSEILTTKDILRNLDEKGKNVAIVLPEPAPLIPLINEVVQSFDKDFNITLGYPIRRSSLFNLIKYIFSLQKTKRIIDNKISYYLPDYLNLIQHPWIKTLEDDKKSGDFRMIVHKIEEILIKKNREEIKSFFSLEEIIQEIHKMELVRIFGDEKRGERVLDRLRKVHSLFIQAFHEAISPIDGADGLFEGLKFIYNNTSVKKYPLNNQFIGTIFNKLEEIRNSLFSNCSFDNSRQLVTFLENYLNKTRIPFVGEPLKGIQIMGMLEARNLNFKKVIVLDVNEGIIPEVKKYDPLLPQHLRIMIGLPGYTEKESIFAYNFYRLIQGAEEVHLLYKEGKLQDIDKNIKSRFIERIIWEKEKESKSLKPENRIFEIKKKTPLNKFIPKKNRKTLKKLLSMEYSPTAIDTYIQCPLKFYYRYVLNLEERIGIEEEIERSTIGKFTHNFLRDYYERFLNRKLHPDRENFLKILSQELEEKFPEGGGSLLLREVIKKTLDSFIKVEIQRASENDIFIRGIEEDLSSEIEVNHKKILMKGRVDRVDEIDYKPMVIDYKTGSVNMPIKTQRGEYAETREQIKKRMKSLQLPIYVYLYSEEKGIDMSDISAKIFNLRKPQEKNNLPIEHLDIFMDALRFILGEIIDEEIPFIPDPNRHCQYCPYRLLCPEV
ncbi:MAG: PD-(D/E)XK nuclease family protein [candidate division WOR-3 bacterium]|nr:PD-(D/E)XK nuclease family protein [candidate division WOR-3 bacterium]